MEVPNLAELLKFSASAQRRPRFEQASIYAGNIANNVDAQVATKAAQCPEKPLAIGRIITFAWQKEMSPKIVPTQRADGLEALMLAVSETMTAKRKKEMAELERQRRDIDQHNRDICNPDVLAGIHDLLTMPGHWAHGEDFAEWWPKHVQLTTPGKPLILGPASVKIIRTDVPTPYRVAGSE